MANAEPATTPRRPFDLPRSLARILDRVSARHLSACLVLVAVSLAAFLPGFFSISPIDRDEARFAQASKQMLETGNFVDIRFHVQARHKKPVGIHWLQVAAVSAGEAVMGPSARNAIFLYRLPSLFAAIGAVLLTYWIALGFTARRGAFVAALLMASCVLLGVEARLAKTDAVLLFTILGSMGALARAYFRAPAQRQGDWTLAAIFWTSLAAGILVKGPMAPLFVGLTIATLAVVNRSAGFMRPLKPLLGVLWCALLVLPWFVAIYIVTKGEFYQHAVGVDMLGKVTEGQEGHWGPPGTYLLAVWGTYWPSVAIAAMTVPFAWRMRRAPRVTFLLAWLVPSWLAFEIAATKLPHYVLPLYPALAILSALALERGEIDKVGKRLADFARLWPVMAFLLAAALCGAFLWLGGSPVVVLLAVPVFIAAVAVLGIALLAFRRSGAESAVLTSALGALLLYFGAYQIVLPQMRAVWISERLAAVAAAQGCPAESIVSVPYQEPSLVFLVGTQIRYTDPKDAVEVLKRGGCALAFIGAPLRGAFEAQAARAGLAYRVVETVDGFAYNGGRMVSITVYGPEGTAQ